MAGGVNDKGAEIVVDEAARGRELHVRPTGRSPDCALTASLAALPIKIVAADKERAVDAVAFKCDYKVPYADAYA